MRRARSRALLRSAGGPPPQRVAIRKIAKKICGRPAIPRCDRGLVALRRQRTRGA